MNVDDLVKQAKQYLDNEKSGVKNEIDMETPNISGMTPDDELSFSVGRLDVLVASIWMLLKAQEGYTDEELMTNVTEIISNRKGKVYSRDVIKCPKCGNNIQEVKKTPLTCRCYYCGATYVMYPYNDKEPDEEPMPLTFEQVEEANAAEIKKSEEAVEELPTNFEPYDVSKDLGFDDEE